MFLVVFLFVERMLMRKKLISKENHFRFWWRPWWDGSALLIRRMKLSHRSIDANAHVAGHVEK